MVVKLRIKSATVVVFTSAVGVEVALMSSVTADVAWTSTSGDDVVKLLSVVEKPLSNLAAVDNVRLVLVPYGVTVTS